MTLSSLSDTRMGSLSGAGTCTLPQTIAAGASYSCAVTENVSGAAATEVSATVTAVATPATGPDVTASEKSVVQILASAPVFRIRTVVGPGQVQFPGRPYGSTSPS